MHAAVVDGKIRCVEDPPEELVVCRGGVGLVERVQRGVHRQLTGNLAAAVTAKTVGQQGDGAALSLLLLVLRLPEPEKVFVVSADRTHPRQLRMR